ncbi:class I SAM-dependent methyltransferase [Pareuzebyella sediminis]|uniref:class I SAM-dependent methyltransferase n=1 Tax=Pareuzebyella sediminis TaxID=2607998 RepID=UPI001E35137B|nr:class I SAM-dependent methyltransferase [Pareuzebyella sediminis]
MVQKILTPISGRKTLTSKSVIPFVHHYGRRLFIGVIMVFSTLSCWSQTAETDSPYSYRKGDPNGTGKWYMGREIAHVMGYQGIGWLERPEREQEERTAVLLENMSIRPEDTVADIGAGSGYHVLKMAPLASKGLIYAVDIQEEMLKALDAKNEKEGFENIALVQGGEKSINLPENSVDKVLMVDVYHEFMYPIAMLGSIKKALKPNGKLFLVEYRGEDTSVPIKKLHKMTEAQAVKEMQAGGMRLERNIENLPWQHCMVFVKQ